MTTGTTALPVTRSICSARTVTPPAADGGSTATRTPVTGCAAQSRGSFTTVRTWPADTSGYPQPKSLWNQPGYPANCTSTATDETPLPAVLRSTMAYCDAFPGSGEVGLVEVSAYQRATSLPMTWYVNGLASITASRAWPGAGAATGASWNRKGVVPSSEKS